MENKFCKNCGKEILFENYKHRNTIYKSRFFYVKYCSKECEKDYVARHRKPYKLAKTEHNEKVLEVNEFVKGDIVHTVHGSYFEDIKKGNDSYEVQMLSKCVLLAKSKKWNKIISTYWLLVFLMMFTKFMTRYMFMIWI